MIVLFISVSAGFGLGGGFSLGGSGGADAGIGGGLGENSSPFESVFLTIYSLKVISNKLSYYL